MPAMHGNHCTDFTTPCRHAIMDLRSAVHAPIMSLPHHLAVML